MLKIRNIFDIENVDEKIITDAMWDSKLRIMHTRDFNIIKFNQKSFSNFVELLMDYQNK